MSEETKNKRKYTRFPEDPKEIAWLTFDKDAYEEFYQEDYSFSPDQAALVVNLSYGGCSLILLDTPLLQKHIELGMKTIVQIGKMDALPAEVKRKEKICEGIYKVGVEFFAAKVY